MFKLYMYILALDKSFDEPPYPPSYGLVGLVWFLCLMAYQPL